MRRFNPRVGALLSVLGLSLLPACGGSDDVPEQTPISTPTPMAAPTASPTAAPTPTPAADPTPTPLSAANLAMQLGLKQFSFNWDPATGASHYRLLEDTDGTSGYSLIWQGSETTHSHVIPLYARLQSSYILETCNASHCVQSGELFVTGSLVDAIGYVKASNPAAWSTFGHSVSLSNDGKTLLVGALHAGLIYIFTESSGVWSQQQMIDSLATSDPDFPSLDLALSGDGRTIAAFSQGTVHIFELGASGWRAQSALALSQNAQSAFRVPLSLSDDGTVVAAGVDGDAHVLVKDSNGWELQAHLAGEGDNLTLSADGNLLATAMNGGSKLNIHSRDGGTWVLQSQIEQFVGSLPSLNFADLGRTLAIGTSEEPSAAQGINGDDMDQSAPGAGAVFVYVNDSGSWTRQAYIKPSNTDPHDRFGIAVDLSSDGSILVVGAYGEDGSATGLNGEPDNAASSVEYDGGSAGAAYVFTRTGGAWSQRAYMKPTSTESEEYGRAVAVSGNGAVIAVGNDYEASASAGIGGDDSDNSAYAAGAVFLY